MIEMLRTYLRALLKSERGATAVEYGIMVALIAVVIIVAVTASARLRLVQQPVAGSRKEAESGQLRLSHVTERAVDIRGTAGPFGRFRPGQCPCPSRFLRARFLSRVDWV